MLNINCEDLTIIIQTMKEHFPVGGLHSKLLLYFVENLFIPRYLAVIIYGTTDETVAGWQFTVMAFCLTPSYFKQVA